MVWMTCLADTVVPVVLKVTTIPHRQKYHREKLCLSLACSLSHDGSGDIEYFMNDSTNGNGLRPARKRTWDGLGFHIHQNCPRTRGLVSMIKKRENVCENDSSSSDMCHDLIHFRLKQLKKLIEFR